MPITHIIFDLDGVLIDATEWHYEALNKALALFGHNISRHEHLSSYNGLPTRTKLEMLSVEKGLPRQLHGMLNRVKQSFTKIEIMTHCSPNFEKEYLLSRLKSEGYVLGVCSNSICSTLEMMLRQAALYSYFDLVLGNEDVSHPKPDPEIYLKAFQTLGCKPEDVLIIEDAPPGIAAARASGARVCEVAGFDDVDYARVRSALEEG